LQSLFLDILKDLFDGFKEVKFSRQRGREICTDLKQTSERLCGSMVKSARLFDDNWIFAVCIFFSLIGSLVFVLPQHIEVDSQLLSKLLPVTMFIWGPVLGVIQGYPAYIRANYALAEMLGLEAKLDVALCQGGSMLEESDGLQGKVTSIEARKVEYDYISKDGDTAFAIGPLSLSITAGEILFIVGGNGSGKSTFLKVLTGLYRPVAGQILVNGTVIDSVNLATYREMISTVFSDFHLFPKLYGLLDVKDESVHDLLAQMALTAKTSFENQRFTRRELSTGQRKRLALIVALLEDRPICVFDEWAADQDPEFRRYFYEELLPMLKNRGKIVILVSHDDRYFHCADRVVTLEYGKIRSIERPVDAMAHL
jgi:putative ATP-binding cassette transporter